MWPQRILSVTTKVHRCNHKRLWVLQQRFTDATPVYGCYRKGPQMQPQKFLGATAKFLMQPQRFLDTTIKTIMTSSHYCFIYYLSYRSIPTPSFRVQFAPLLCVWYMQFKPLFLLSLRLYVIMLHAFFSLKYKNWNELLTVKDVKSNCCLY